MITEDLIPDLIDVLGYVPDDVLFGRLSDALEVLATKGDWDGNTAYLDIDADSLVITCPDDVLSPIKILINDNPSFSRSQIYEFTMNGPTTDMREVRGWSWMDNQYSPVAKQPSQPQAVAFTADHTQDNGVVIRIEARDEEGKMRLATATIGVNNGLPVPDGDGGGGGGGGGGATKWKYITRIHKPVTFGPIRIIGHTDLQLLSVYLHNETDPQYRQIRISDGNHIKMVYKRKTYRVSSRLDFIPLKSKTSILMMCRALELFRKSETAEGLALAKTLEDTAIMRIQDDHKSRHTAEANAAQTEIQPTLDTNYSNADSVIMADIYDPACSIFGFLGRDNIFDQVSDAIRLLNGKCQWDSREGYVDLIVDNYEYITLPRYVDNPLAININGRPKAFRNEWYEFHLNGPGSDMLPCNTWHYVGEVPIIRPLPGVLANLLAHCELPQDAGKKLRVFGWDANGKKLFSNHGGEYKEGVEVTMTYMPPTSPLNTSAEVLVAPTAMRIERVEKDETVGFVHFNAFFPNNPVSPQQTSDTQENLVRTRVTQSGSRGDSELFVASTNGFLTSGTATIEILYRGRYLPRATFDYTGLSSASFTGCNLPIPVTTDNYVSQATNNPPMPPPPTPPPPPSYAIIPLGYYEPDETAPNYVQIRIPRQTMRRDQDGIRTAWVRMRYRKRQSKITSLSDPIHLKSQLAIIMAMQAVKAYTATPPDVKAGQDLEDKAVKLLQEEMDSRRPPGDTFTMQFQGIQSEVIL